MDERDARQVAERLWRALQAGDWETAGGCLHDDFVQEWPQSRSMVSLVLGIDTVLVRDAAARSQAAIAGRLYACIAVSPGRSRKGGDDRPSRGRAARSG